MGKLALALLIVLAVDLFLFFSQEAMGSINPDFNNTLFDSEHSILSDYDAGDHTLNESDYIDRIPSAVEGVETTDSGLFTDIYKTISTWFKGTTLGKGVTFITRVIGAPYYFLSNPALGLPQNFIWGVGALWYGLTIFLILGFTLGRDV